MIAGLEEHVEGTEDEGTRRKLEVRCWQVLYCAYDTLHRESEHLSEANDPCRTVGRILISYGTLIYVRARNMLSDDMIDQLLAVSWEGWEKQVKTRRICKEYVSYSPLRRF